MDQIINEVVQQFKVLAAKQALAYVAITYDAAHLDAEYDEINKIEPEVILAILVHQPIFGKENILKVFSEKKLTVAKLFSQDDSTDIVGLIDVIDQYVNQYDGATLVDQWVVRPILKDLRLTILN